MIGIGDRAFHRLTVLYAVVGLGAGALLLFWLLGAFANSMLSAVMFAADQPSAKSWSIVLLPIAYSLALLAGAILALAGAARLSRGTPGRGFTLLALGGSLLSLVTAGLLAPPFHLSPGELAGIAASSLPGWLASLSLVAGPVLLAAAVMTAARARGAGREPARARSRRFLLVCAVPLLVAATVVPAVIDERRVDSRFREYALPAGYRCCGDSPLVIGSDGALWFVELLSRRIGRIAPDGVVTQFDTSSQPSHLVRAGELLWFDLKNPARLASIGPAGGITEHPLPSLAVVTGILGAPDGAIWFIDGGTYSVGRLNVDGSIQEFPIPGLMGPREVTFESPSLVHGSDGAIWFAENAGQTFAGDSRIDRVGPDGVVVARTLPGGRGIESPLIVAPDGALWFFTRDAFIGRMTTNGDYSEYPSGPNSSKLKLTPGGGLWHAYAYSNALFQLSLQGELTKHSLPKDITQPAELIIGPDGIIWFVAESKNQQVVVRMDADTNVTVCPVPNSAKEWIDPNTAGVIGGDGGLWLPRVGAKKIYRFQP